MTQEEKNEICLIIPELDISVKLIKIKTPQVFRNNCNFIHGG